MWHLKTVEIDGSWVTAGQFETLADASQRIVELEGYAVTGVFFELFIEPLSDDDDALGHLEHTGKVTRRPYILQRIRH